MIGAPAGRCAFFFFFAVFLAAAPPLLALLSEAGPGWVLAPLCPDASACAVAAAVGCPWASAADTAAPAAVVTKPREPLPPRSWLAVLVAAVSAAVWLQLLLRVRAPVSAPPTQLPAAVVSGVTSRPRLLSASSSCVEGTMRYTVPLLAAGNSTLMWQLQVFARCTMQPTCTRRCCSLAARQLKWGCPSVVFTCTCNSILTPINCQQSGNIQWLMLCRRTCHADYNRPTGVQQGCCAHSLWHVWQPILCW